NANITINVSTTTTWTGTSTNWFDASNWCGGIPTSNRDVLIPSGLSNYPNVLSGNALCRDLTLQSNTSLTISSVGGISISGNTNNDGNIINNGRITLNGTLAQSFPGGNSGVISKMNVLEVSKQGIGTNGDLNFNRKFSITDTGTLRLRQANTVTLQDTITIKSTATGTARIDSIGAGVNIEYIGIGAFTIERYIPTGVVHGKSWQMLSTPTSGQTIRQAWQEGASGVGNNPRPGYGTTITSNLTGATSTLGFDFYTQSGGTMRVYDAATNTYIGVPNTLTTPIYNPKGYMFFVRGDRSILTSSAPANEVVLRTTGRIFYGTGIDSAVSIQVPAGKFQSIGNPYASPIDFTKLLAASSGINPTYYVWDPTLQSGNGLGAFQTISSFSGWQSIPGGTSNYPTSLVNTRVQSGQAFFVYSGSGGRIRFNEQVKTDGYRSVLRQPSSEPITIKTTLLDGQGHLLDGHLLAVDPAGLNEEDEFDAPKPNNVGENIGLVNESRVLSLDVRQQLTETDTIRLRIWNLKTQAYRLAFCPQRWASLGLQPILGDRFTGTSTIIGISDSTFYSFSVLTDPASRSEGRFYIYFRGLRPLPVQFVDVKATKRGDDALIEWKVGEESAIAHYDVERSSDGTRFTKIGEVSSGSVSKTYELTDIDPAMGVNFYRIRAVSLTESPTFSKIVTVAFDNKASGFTIYPNPVTDRQATLTVPDGLEGVFTLQLFDSQGKKIQSTRISLTQNVSQHRLMIGRHHASGSYRLVLTDEAGVSRYTTWLMVD
ncbi:MAG: T9SS type A sorting domain-containing protein, partial [Ferruginibacter sp.]